MTDAPMLFADGELPAHPTPLVQRGIDAWNEAAAVAGWPAVTAKTASRMKRLETAIQDCGGVVGWKSTLVACQESPFLMGKTTPPFTLTFDWLTKPANLVKVLEGNYRDRQGAARESWREKQAREAREAVERALPK